LFIFRENNNTNNSNIYFAKLSTNLSINKAKEFHSLLPEEHTLISAGHPFS